MWGILLKPPLSEGTPEIRGSRHGVAKVTELSSGQLHRSPELSFLCSSEPANALQHVLICRHAPPSTTARGRGLRQQVRGFPETSRRSGHGPKSVVTRVRPACPHISTFHRIWGYAVFTVHIKRGQELYPAGADMKPLAGKAPVSPSLLLISGPKRLPAPMPGLCLLMARWAQK